MIRHIFVFGVLIPTIITIILFLGFLLCWFRYNIFERLFNKQNRPRRFKNSFSAHSVNSTQRIVQFNREEEYDNEKNDDLCGKRDEFEEKCDECDCDLTDEIGEVTDFILEDDMENEVFKEILYDPDDCDIHCNNLCNEIKRHNFNCTCNKKENVQGTRYTKRLLDIQGESCLQTERSEMSEPFTGQAKDREDEGDHSVHLQGRPLSMKVSVEMGIVSEVSGPVEPETSRHLSTGLSHVKRYHKGAFR